MNRSGLCFCHERKEIALSKIRRSTCKSGVIMGACRKFFVRDEADSKWLLNISIVTTLALAAASSRINIAGVIARHCPAASFFLENQGQTVNTSA